MTKYIVWQKREFMFYQEVEATSKTQAVVIAEDTADWEQDQNYAEIEYLVEEQGNQPEVDDLIKNEEEHNG